jgi:ADP-ribosylglycohydrolase
VKKLGEGWIAEEALAVGLYAAFRGRSFREALAIAANHSGDSDSTASIAGQIWGTRQGLDDIPHAWVQSLDVNKPLTGLVGRWLRQGLQP